MASRAATLGLILVRTIASPSLVYATVYSQALRVQVEHNSSPSAPPNISVLFSSTPLPVTPDVLAWAEYNDTIPSNGWATLAVSALDRHVWYASAP